jgi:hypothetical protein
MMTMVEELGLSVMATPMVSDWEALLYGSYGVGQRDEKRGAVF